MHGSGHLSRSAAPYFRSGIIPFLFSFSISCFWLELVAAQGVIQVQVGSSM